MSIDKLTINNILLVIIAVLLLIASFKGWNWF